MADPLLFKPLKVLANVRQASTEDLLNRVTVYRAGMEAEALAIIEEELERRGVGWRRIEDHAKRMQDKFILGADGVAACCSFCPQPAVAQGWGWHRLWGKLPVFPRFFFYCEQHAPKKPS